MMVTQIKNTIDHILKFLCAILFLFLVFLNFYQVFMRYIVNNPSTISEDLLGYTFVWLSLLGTALVFGNNDHINVPIFSDKLTGIKKVILQVFTELLIMIIAIAVFIIGGKIFMDVGAMQSSPTLDITMNWIYAILPISGALIVIYNVVNIINAIQNYTRKKEEEVK